MSVGENIRSIREERGITKSGLAQQAGVSIAMICQVERGTKNPSLQLAAEIARALGCELGELLRERA